MTKKSPKPVDIHVGSRVRMARTMQKMSQEQLGKALKITFQQIQKYEKGTNRIGSSRLAEISMALGLPISYFYEGLEELPEGQGNEMPEFMQAIQSQVGTRLIQVFCEASEEQRVLIADLARTVVNKGQPEAAQ